MSLEHLIRSLQSRIAKRSNQITALEAMKHDYKEMGLHVLYQACREEIKPLAVSQKEDKCILDILCDIRTTDEWYERAFEGEFA